MNLDEIEDAYRKKTELIDQELLSKLESGKKINELEKAYRKKTKQARDEYNKRIELLLKKQKAGKGKNTARKKEKFDRLRVKEEDITRSFTDRLKIKVHSYLFKINIRSRDKLKKSIPIGLIYFWKRTRIRVKIFFRSIEHVINKKKERIKKYISKSSAFMQEKGKNIYEKAKIFLKKLKEFLKKVISKIPKGKKKDEKKDSENKNEEAENSPAEDSKETSQETEESATENPVSESDNKEEAKTEEKS